MAECPSSHQIARIREETLDCGNLFGGSSISASDNVHDWRMNDVDYYKTINLFRQSELLKPSKDNKVNITLNNIVEHYFLGLRPIAIKKNAGNVKFTYILAGSFATALDSDMHASVSVACRRVIKIVLSMFPLALEILLWISALSRKSRMSENCVRASEVPNQWSVAYR